MKMCPHKNLYTNVHSSHTMWLEVSNLDHNDPYLLELMPLLIPSPGVWAEPSNLPLIKKIWQKWWDWATKILVFYSLLSLALFLVHSDEANRHAMSFPMKKPHDEELKEASGQQPARNGGFSVQQATRSWILPITMSLGTSSLANTWLWLWEKPRGRSTQLS